MKHSSTLVFTTCYNERDNIGSLIDQITCYASGADILVVDDNYPDGTWEVIKNSLSVHSNLHAVKRPGKLGIGSAPKYAIIYAIREGYETLVTMDEDFHMIPDRSPIFCTPMVRIHSLLVHVTALVDRPTTRSTGML